MDRAIELKANQTIVFIGDSITDADREQIAYKPLGFGYVHFVSNWLLAKYPHLNLNIINTGISGNTIRDLKRRWEKDCIRHNPDILSVLIGVNDLWRQHESDDELPDAVYPKEYESTYKELLSTAKQQCDCQLVLMEPFMFCDDCEDTMFKGLSAYVRSVRTIAEQFEAVLVPLQSRIDEQIKGVPSEKWAADFVHPYLWAHGWIAQRWLEATCL